MSHGQTLGRYTLIEQLAIGGMAEIWLAHMAGPEGFEKVVVIKKIRPHLQGQKNFLNMFLNEARLAAHLNHPNIVQIHEFGKPKNQYYIAMEYIFGRDLSEIVPKAKRANIPFPIEYASKIIAQVCEGLYYAHTKSDNKGQPLQIIHRDISPQNVLVSFDGHVKILDFGIAKAANQYEQTQQGILKGKVSYMSPEQILGNSVDSRADIFSLGAVFYELLTGYKLFSGDNELAILRSITDGPIYPPSYFNEDIPDELEEIIMKALAKDPEERYPNAWEMQRALNQLLTQFDFHPTNTHLANFLKQLFEDEIEQESQYLESKINEVVRGVGAPLHEEEEEEEEPSIVLSAALLEEVEEVEEIHEIEEFHEIHAMDEISSLEELTGVEERGEFADMGGGDAPEEVAAPFETPPKTPTRKVNYDTRPDIESFTLSEADEVPSFAQDYDIELVDRQADLTDDPQDEQEATTTPAPEEDFVPDTQNHALNNITDSGPSPLFERSQPNPQDTTRHELAIGELAISEFASEQVSSAVTSPEEFDPSKPLDLSAFEEPTQSVQPSAQSLQQPADPLDDSISQILFTIRFRSSNYDELKELADYHNMSLEQLVHAMLQCARPFFETEPTSNELDSAEFDINSSS